MRATMGTDSFSRIWVLIYCCVRRMISFSEWRELEVFSLAAGEPPYIRVLAANEKGRAYLRQIAGKTTIPVVTKPAAVKELGVRAQAMFAVGASAHDLYTLSFLSIEDRKGGSDWRTGPKIV